MDVEQRSSAVELLAVSDLFLNKYRKRDTNHLYHYTENVVLQALDAHCAFQCF